MPALLSEPALWRALLTALLLTACATDLRARRIPNPLVLALLGAAVVRALLGGPVAPGAALLAAGLGLLLWLPPYALRVLGAGDVKLFAAAAAWIGPVAVPRAALAAGVAGGLLGLAWLLARLTRATVGALRVHRFGAPAAIAAHAAACGGVLPALATRLRASAQADRRTTLPYGLAIAAGILAVVWAPGA